MLHASNNANVFGSAWRLSDCCLQCRDGQIGKYNCTTKVYSDAGLSGGLASNADEDFATKIFYYLSVYLPIYIPIYLSIYLPTYLPIYLSIYLYLLVFHVIVCGACIHPQQWL